MTAALRASELGASVALVERNRLGGTCTNDGCVPTRVLAKAARLVRDADQFEEFGLSGAAPQVDFQKLLAHVQRTVYRIHEKKQLLKHLSEAGVTPFVQVGDAHFTNPNTIKLEDGRKIEGQRFILCVGGHSRRFPFPGSEYAITHHDIWTMKSLPRSVVIVGGANTGCQIASILNAFGTRVTVLEVNDRILGVEDQLVSKVAAEAFRKRGVEIITGMSGVERIEKVENGLKFFYKYNEEVHWIETEAVILAVGWVGNVDALNLQAAGVETTPRSYIQVNDYLQTSAAHIFAAGDITGRMMLVQSGSYEGRVAAENAMLGVGQPQKHLIVPHGSFTDPEYAGVGLTEAQARQKGEVAVAVVPYADMDRAVIDGYPEGFCKLIVSTETHRVLGAHIVGEQATEVVQLVATGMTADLWVEQLAEIELAYPTVTAIVGVAARRIVADLGVTPLAPQWRTLGKTHSSEWERSEIFY